MEFTDYIEQYPNVLPEWIKNIPIGIIEEIQALGFELTNIYSDIYFHKDFGFLPTGKLVVTKEGIEINIPSVKDINKIPEHIIFLEDLQRINFIVNEYLVTVK
jgi:hypothetical protein